MDGSTFVQLSLRRRRRHHYTCEILARVHTLDAVTATTMPMPTNGGTDTPNYTITSIFILYYFVFLFQLTQ